MNTNNNKHFVLANGEIIPAFQPAACPKNDPLALKKNIPVNHQKTIWVASILAATMINSMQSANAALISPCSGVSLPPSVITNIVGAAVLPITSTLDSVPLLSLLGLNTNLTNTLAPIAAGAPINLNVLDTSGNVVSPATDCQTTADGYTLDTPKGISIGGNQITGLGNGAAANAGELNSVAFGNGSFTDAAAANAVAIGPNSSVGNSGTDSVALGSGANTNVANSVALGAASAATTGAESNYAAYALTTPQTSVGEVSIGSAGNTRKLTNVAAGSAATDAVNVSQLQAVDDGAIKYDPLSLKLTATLGGPLSVDGGVTGGTRITNLAQGAVNATSTDAINGSQLFNATSGVAVNLDALGLSMATNLGGGAAYNLATGIVSAPTYAVYGTPQNNVGSAIAALQANAPIQYSDVNGVATPNTPSNDITLVGSAAGPVTIHNVADGVAATDAVNKGQLDAVQNSVGNLDALAVKYDDPTKNVITFAGAPSTDGGITDGTTMTT